MGSQQTPVVNVIKRSRRRRAFVPTSLAGLILWLRAGHAVTSAVAVPTMPAPKAFDDAAWGPSNIVVLPNDTTDPDGGSEADGLVEAPGLFAFRVIEGDPAGEVQGAMTHIIDAKRSDLDFVYLFAFGDGIDQAIVWFDLLNGAVGTVQSGTPEVMATGAIVSLGNGWYRCSMSFNTIICNFGIGLSRDDGVLDYNVVVPRKLWVHNARVEQHDQLVIAWGNPQGQGATQSVAREKPRKVSSAWAGRPVVRFLATNDTLPTWMDLAGLVDPSHSYTVVAAVDQRNAATVLQQLLSTFGGSNDFVIASCATDTAGVGGFVGHPAPTWLSIAAAVNGKQVLTWKWDADANLLTVYRNGVSLGTATYASDVLSIGSTTALGRYRGGGHYLDADVGELLVYNTALGDADREDVEGYTMDQYPPD